ncbi:MAG: hypothetical protein ACRDIY_05265 [Chloroflexota bacterium]
MHRPTTEHNQQVVGSTSLTSVMLKNLARAHSAPDQARREVHGRVIDLLRPTLDQFAAELSGQARDDKAAPIAVQTLRRALDQAIDQLWDAIVAAHAEMAVAEPFATHFDVESGYPPIDRNVREAVGHVLDESAVPLRAAFLARGLRALARLAPELADHELGEAVGASSDFALLARALERPEAIAALRQEDPLAEARLRGISMRERLLQAEGGTFTAEQVAQHLRMTRQAVDKRRRAGRLIAFSAGRRGYLYPVWQFGADGTLPGLERILSQLAVHDPWMQAAFFLSGDPRLSDRSPLEALRAGEVEAVCRAARGYGEHSAA